MEQRRLRLGDILDDYCPRERRVTNHAVVAMIEENVKQTRCTTCDAEHAYKGARVPKRRKAETTASLYKDVLSGRSDADRVRADAAPPAGDASADGVPAILVPPPERIVRSGQPEDHKTLMTSPDPDDRPDTTAAIEAHVTSRLHQPVEDIHPQRGQALEEDSPQAVSDPDEPPLEPGSDGPVHRRLIRATLPRPEGQKDTRPIPEFTVRQSPARGNGHGAGQFRGDRTRLRGHALGQGEPNGNRAPGNQARHQGGRGGGRPPGGRGAATPGFRGANAGPKGRRGRGPR